MSKSDDDKKSSDEDEQTSSSFADSSSSSSDNDDELLHELRNLPQLRSIDLDKPWPEILKLSDLSRGRVRTWGSEPGKATRVCAAALSKVEAVKSVGSAVARTAGG